MATQYTESAPIRAERHMLTRAAWVSIEQLCRERGICSESDCELPIMGWCQDCDTRGAFHAPKLCAFHLSAHCRSMGHAPHLPYLAGHGPIEQYSQDASTRSARCAVMNKRSGAPFDIYIGRPSPFGNPYRIGPDGTRADVIAKYRAYILASDALLSRVPELIGKRLACWCAPLPCHGDVLAELATLAQSWRESGSPLPLPDYIRQAMAAHAAE